MQSIARLLALILLASTSLVACSLFDLSREAHPTTLGGTAWRVVSVNGRPPVAGSEPTAVFAPTQVAGSSGCNSYSGQYTYEPSSGAIEFRDLATTLMLCTEEARNDVETLFTTALTQATSASIDPAGRLVLTGPGGEIVLAVDAVSS
jgi:heat shock protein HslJ